MNLMYKSKNKLPTEKMILDLLNGEDISEEILYLYHNYIVAASTMTINNVVYDSVESYVDEDLMQSIRMNIITCLPNLRKNLIRHLDSKDRFKINIR